MLARDIMTRDVVSITPDTPVRRIAAILVEQGISAVPVVDETGLPIGVVSEGDLIGRDQSEKAQRRDWWLTLLAEGETLHPDFLAMIEGSHATARSLMSAPVITIGEDTEAGEIAHLMATYRIKRLPVVEDGHIVGIVSRADLLHAIAGTEKPPRSPKPGNGFIPWIENHVGHEAAPAPPPEAPSTDRNGGLMVADFRHLVDDHKEDEARKRATLREEMRAQRREAVKHLVEDHITDQAWKKLIHEARQAAEHGETEYLLLRFPSQLCSDGGRAINVPDREWPETLRGEAAEIYLRWERDLRPRGFRLAARVLDFPDGIPGDIGLFLVWA